MDYNGFIGKWNLNFSEEKFNVIKRSASDVKEENENILTAKKGVDILTFCNRFKKGSKPFRRVLRNFTQEEIPRNINTYAENTQIIIELEMGQKVNGLWGFWFFTNDIRILLFKMHSNILGLNNRVAHFIRDHSPMDTAQVVSIQAHNPSIQQASKSAGSTAGYSQVSEAEESEDDENNEPGQVSLGSAYAQCKAAREATNRRIVVDISCNENAMVSSTLGGDRVGSMDRGIDKSIENCFKGPGLRKNGVLVNQYLSCSFDLAPLVCITCENEHKLLEGGEGTECYCLTDQNFIATLPGSESKDCLKIIRFKNASLVELAYLFLEILEGKNVKPGTCVLVSLLSYLTKVGAAAYAAEWRVYVNMLTCKWAGILVCPVFPFHTSAIPGNLFGELLILHTWFRKIYSGTNQGLSSSWDKYAELLLEFSEGAGSLEQPELRTPLLPSSLDPAASFEVFHFSTSSTCPAVIFGFDRKAPHKLLLSLSTSLRRGFLLPHTPRPSSQGTRRLNQRETRRLQRY